MDRQDAYQLAEGAVGALEHDVEGKLRPILADVFEGMNEPTHVLTFGTGDPTVYLLGGGSLVIVIARLAPLGVDVDCVDLSRATLTRRCHDIQDKPGGVYWETTWRLTAHGLEDIVFSGVEGPPGTVDEVTDFGFAVAQAAGWPIEPPTSR